jgi:hypothetical protein
MRMDGISIDRGDGVEVATDPDGYRGIRVANRVWVEAPRWIYVTVDGKHDRRHAFDELIHALETLRDEPDDSGR